MFINWVWKPTQNIDIKGNLSNSSQPPCPRTRLTDSICSKWKHSVVYVAIRSAYLNYEDFRSSGRDVMKPSRACFGHFECTLPLAQLNKCNWLQKNYVYVISYICSTNYYFCDFSLLFVLRFESQTQWKLVGVWNSAKRDTTSSFASGASRTTSTKPTVNKRHPSGQVVPGRGGSRQRWREGTE